MNTRSPATSFSSRKRSLLISAWIGSVCSPPSRASSTRTTGCFRVRCNHRDAGLGDVVPILDVLGIALAHEKNDLSDGFSSSHPSDCGLKARKYYLLVCAIPIHRSTVEIRFFIVDLHLDIPIEIPIQSHTGLSRLAGGLR